MKIPLMPIGVLAHGSAHTRPSAQSPIDVSGNFPAHVSAEWPSNISPSPSKKIKKWGEANFPKKLRINFLAKSDNSKSFSFFHFFLLYNLSKLFQTQVCFEMDFGDLMASAEQVTAEIDGSRAGDLPSAVCRGVSSISWTLARACCGRLG